MTGALRPAKRAVRRHVGLWRALEWRNRVMYAPRLPALRRFEDAEVARLAPITADRPPTMVATVMAAYRRPELLRRAIASALAQTVADHTLIVVDDGGGLPADLPTDPRLVTVSLAANSAVLGLVRNVGIRLTRSTYVAILDDDNEWRPDHLRLALAGLAAGADIVYTAVERRLPDGRQLDVLSVPFDRRRLADESFVDSNSLVLRRDPDVLFSRIPRVKATLPKEDWEFVFRLSRRRAVRHLPEPTVRYLVNTDSYYTDWKPPEPTGSGFDEPATG